MTYILTFTYQKEKVIAHKVLQISQCLHRLVSEKKIHLWNSLKLLLNAHGIPTILSICPQLMLPVDFSLCQPLFVAQFHLLNQNKRNVLIAAVSLTSKVLPKTSNFFLYLLFVVAVSLFKLCCGLANILPPTPPACCQVNQISTVTVKPLLDVVDSLCIGASEFFSFLDNRTGHLAVVAFKASSIYIWRPVATPGSSSLVATCSHSLDVLWLLGHNLDVFASLGPVVKTCGLGQRRHYYGP